MHKLEIYFCVLLYGLPKCSASFIEECVFSPLDLSYLLCHVPAPICMWAWRANIALFKLLWSQSKSISMKKKPYLFFSLKTVSAILDLLNDFENQHAKLFKKLY